MYRDGEEKRKAGFLESGERFEPGEWGGKSLLASGRP